jgi:antitoxin component of RelBE/YafQ-DinJ toxin-antitoxin module
MELSWAVRKDRSYKILFNVRLPVKVKKELEKVAKKKGLTVSDLVRLGIEKILEEELNEK